MSYRRLLGNVMSAAATRGLNLVSTLLVVPMTVRGLGPEDYGILATLLSATIIFAYADLGLGLAIVNRIAGAPDDHTEAGRVVSRTFYFLSAIAVASCAAAGLVYFGVKVFAPATGQAEAWLVAALCVGAGLPSGLAQRIMFAYQQGLSGGMWTALGRLVSLAGVAGCLAVHGPLAAYVFAILGLPALVGWVSLLWLMLRVHRHLRPSLRGVDWLHLRGDARTGGQFLMLQLAIYVETGIDNLLIGAFKGPMLVMSYDIVFRLFNYIPALVSILSFPLWPALRDARARQDEAWFNRTIRWSLAVVGGGGLAASLFLLGMAPTVIRLWTHVIIDNWALNLSMACLCFAGALHGVQAMVLNAQDRMAEQVRSQVVCVPIILIGKTVLLLFAPVYTIAIWTAAVIVGRVVWLWRRGPFVGAEYF